MTDVSPATDGNQLSTSLFPYGTRTETSFVAWINSVNAFTRFRFEQQVSEDELVTFEEHMKRKASNSPATLERSFTYSQLKKIVKDASTPAFIRRLFSRATHLLHLFHRHADSMGYLSLRQFIFLIRHAAYANHFRLLLMSEAKSDTLHITHDELADFLIRQVESLEWVREDEFDFVVCLAERKFAFFLDSVGLHRYKINHIVVSGFLQEFDSSRSEEVDCRRNWFSRANYQEVLAEFRRLDRNSNGLISAEELMEFDDLNPLFVERVFQVTCVYETTGEMDFKAFCDFLLCMRHIDTLAAWQYVFRVLDFNGDGKLTINDVRDHVSAILARIEETRGGVIPDLEAVVFEIYDIASKPDADFITLEDIRKSRYGTVFFKVLTSVTNFILYDDRESNSININKGDDF